MSPPELCPTCGDSGLRLCHKGDDLVLRCQDRDCDRKHSVLKFCNVLSRVRYHNWSCKSLLQGIRAYCSTPLTMPSAAAVSKIVEVNESQVRDLFDNLRAAEARAGKEDASTAEMTGNLECDGTCVKKFYVHVNSGRFSDATEKFQSKNPGNSPDRLLIYHRVAGILERGGNGRLILASLPLEPVRPDGGPPTESKNDIQVSKLLERVCGRKAFMHSDGNIAWQSECRSRKIAQASVVHSKMEFARKLTPEENRKSKAAWKSRPMKTSKVQKNVNGKAPRGVNICGTQSIDSTWRYLKRYMPGSLPALTADKSRLNPKVWQYMFSFQFRRNIVRCSADLLFDSLGKVVQAR